MTSIYVAIGKTARSKKIVAQREVSFEQLAAMLQAAPIHVGKLTIGDYTRMKVGTPAEKAEVSRDKDTAWFSLAKYIKPERKAEHVEAVSAFVGDFDSGELTEEEISAKVAGYKHITLTTYSHTPEHPKYRLIVPYSKPVTPAEHAVLFESFMTLFGEQVDSSTRDSCRLWFFPSCTADTRMYQAIKVHDDGEVFEPYDMATPAIEDDDPLPQKESLDESVNSDLASAESYSRPTAEQVQRMLAHIQIPDEEGKRRGPWFTVLCGVHHWAEGSDEGFQIADEWSSQQPGYVDTDDVRKIWDSIKRKDGVTIASVIKMAVDAGYTHEDDIPADIEITEVLEETGVQVLLDGGGASFRELAAQKEANYTGDNAKLRAALAALEDRLVFVIDQQEYFDLQTRELINKDGIRQIFRAHMPARKDPCYLLERSPNKRIVASQGYHPGKDALYVENGRALVNLHTPFDPDPLIPTARELDLFTQMVRHLFCKKQDALFMDWILKFFAYAVQNPGKKITSAPLLYSRETGTGKTTLMLELPRALFGPYNCKPVGNDEIDSGFTDYLARVHLIHLDEIFMGGMKQAAAAADRFKPIITNRTLKVHPKGHAGYEIENRLIVTACSNHDNAVFLTDHDRRWAVHEVKGGKMDKVFAEELYTFMESARGPGVLKHIFQRISTTSFRPFADAPVTAEKRAMISASRSDDEALLADGVQNHTGPFAKDVFTMDDVSLWIEASLGRKVSPRRISVLFASGGVDVRMVRQLRWGKARVRIYCARNHDHWMSVLPQELGAAIGITDGITEDAA